MASPRVDARHRYRDFDLQRWLRIRPVLDTAGHIVESAVKDAGSHVVDAEESHRVHRVDAKRFGFLGLLFFLGFRVLRERQRADGGQQEAADDRDAVHDSSVSVGVDGAWVRPSNPDPPFHGPGGRG